MSPETSQQPEAEFKSSTPDLADPVQIIEMSPEGKQWLAEFDRRQAEELAELRRKSDIADKKFWEVYDDFYDNPAEAWLSEESQNSVGAARPSAEVVLPPKLRNFVSAEKLSENAAKYPEMSYEIDSQLLEQVRQKLLKLPLVHRTKARELAPGPVKTEGGFRAPVPYSWLSQASNHKADGNTYGLDLQTDLDEYVFMSWGGIYGERKSFLAGSRYAVLVSSDLLMDPRCVVTPLDVGAVASGKVMDKGLVVSDRRAARELRDEYFDKMVTGADWVEIESRRIAKRIMDGNASLDNLGELAMEDLGEVKFLGEVPRSSVIASVDTATEYPDYRDFIKTETGFSLPSHGKLARRFLY